MGIHENVMATWKVVPSSLKFAALVTMAVAFFSQISGMGLLEHKSIQSDVIASSMSFLSMHNDSRVNLTWDQTPFVMSVPEGSLLVVFKPRLSTASPYPLTIPPEGSTDCRGVPCFKGADVELFRFISSGDTRVVVAE